MLSLTIDRHEAEDPYHPENQLFPPHNLAGSEGRNLYGTLAAVYEDHKEKENVYWIDKRHYSAFSGTDLDIRLRERKYYCTSLFDWCLYRYLYLAYGCRCV